MNDFLKILLIVAGTILSFFILQVLVQAVAIAIVILFVVGLVIIIFFREKIDL